MSKPNNPLAFPKSTSLTGPDGMYLRDYFAAKAMQSLIVRLMQSDLSNKTGQEVRDAIAEASYKAADTMLAQREKE